MNVQLKSKEQVIGKIVSGIATIGEEMVITFSDNTCLFIDVEWWGESYELTIASDFDPLDTTQPDELIRAGVLTSDEYDALRAAKIAQRKAEMELYSLKAAYGDQ